MTWISQAQGYSRRKYGTVVEVVPPNAQPETFIPGRGLTGRREESYVVKVGRTRHMWPRTAHLEPAEGRREGEKK